MKKALFTLVALMGVYWMLGNAEAPESSEMDSQVEFAAPAQASLLSQLPGRRESASVALPTIVKDEGTDTVARRAADDYIEANRDQWGVQAYHELHLDNQFASPLGTVVKYKIYQGEFPIHGMDVEVRVGSDGRVQDAAVHYTPVAEVDLQQPRMSVDDITYLISNRFERGAGDAGTPVIFVPSTAGSAPELGIALSVVRKGSSEVPAQAIFRASDGQILDLTVARAEFLPQAN